MIIKIFKNKWLLRVIGVALFIFILCKINLRETLSVLSGINIYYFLIVICIMTLGSIIKPYRWKYILKISEINYPFWKTFKLYFIGLFLGIITPGRVGEAGKIFYLKKDNHPTSKSMISIFIDRLADLIYLIVFGYLGLFLFFNLFKKLIWALTILIFICLVLICLTIKIKSIKAPFKRIIIFLIPEKYKEKSNNYISELIKIINQYKPKDYLIIFGLTILCWIPAYISLYFLVKSVGLYNVSFLYLVISMTIASLITLLPITISGLGTREAALLLLFSPLGIASEKVIAFSLSIFFANFLVSSVIGLWFWVKDPLRDKNK